MAIADIICGDVNPSGKLADTIPDSYDSYQNAQEFLTGFEHLDYLMTYMSATAISRRFPAPPKKFAIRSASVSLILISSSAAHSAARATER